jgi:hypothetical protein
MSYLTAWIIGSIKSLDYALTVNASAQTVTGSRYLYHPTLSLSILGGIVAAMTAAGVAGAAAVLTQDRRVKISAGGTFSITWTDTGLRDLLGFTGNLAAAASYTATNVSPLLWSPAKPLRPELSPRGTAGLRTPLAYYTQSPYDGSTFVVSHGSRVDQRYSCGMVAIDRVFTDDEAGGEWVRFFNDCAAKGYSFYVYQDVTEESGSTTTATLTGGLGPYVLTPQGRAPTWSYARSRGFDWCDKRADIAWACRTVPEYT